MLDTLHSKGAFTKIVAVCPDVASARKRLMGRSARYTGLLDVLEFAASTEASLEGADAVLAFNVSPSDAAAQAAAAKAAGVKHLVLVARGEGPADFSAAVAALEGSDTAYTFFQAGDFLPGREGGGLAVSPASEGASCVGGVCREDVIRAAAESFFLLPAKDKAFVMNAGDAVALEYQRGLRSKGYTRDQEMGFLLTGGYQEFAANKTAEEAKKAAAKSEAEAKKESSASSVSEDSKDRLARWATEREAMKEELITAKIESESEKQFIAQRYAKEKLPDHGDDIQIGDRDLYFERNKARISAWVRENAQFDEKGQLFVLTEEDYKREKDIKQEAARAARRQAQLKAQEAKEAAEVAAQAAREAELEAQLEDLKFVHQGVTYLKYEAEGREVILDEDGVKILGQWNKVTNTIDSYDGPDLGLDEEDMDIVAEKDE